MGNGLAASVSQVITEQQLVGSIAARMRRTYGAEFATAFHPHVCAFVKELKQHGITGLLAVKNQALSNDLPTLPRFWLTYVPTSEIRAPLPREDVDFDPDGAYSLYNWELFLHVPMLLAGRLARNQQFAEAIRVLHFIFNPTDSGSDAPPKAKIWFGPAIAAPPAAALEPAPARYWKFLPFKTTPAERLDQMFLALAYDPAASGDPPAVQQAKLKARAALEAQVRDWRAHPFQPHRIARLRPLAYEKTIVMKYVDTLVAWGDQLFRRDTIESINEATQLYVLAANILGKRPARTPARGTIQPETYASLRARGLDAFGNALVALENEFPFSSAPPAGSGGAETLLGIGRTLYFCIPQNDKLLGYWDTIADRLFKIRHCMNIEGVVRELPLFEPPIDPALVVQAAARGVDLSSVLADLSAPLPHYRFTFLLQKALEVCNDVRGLGGALLAALERRDLEALTAIRASQETAVLTMVRAMKAQQYDDAVTQREALNRARDQAVFKYMEYQRRLGNENPQVPAIGATVAAVATGGNSKVLTEGGVKMIAHEKAELDSQRNAADDHEGATFYEIAANLAHYVPKFAIEMAPFGVGTTTEFGGDHIAPALTAKARESQVRSARNAQDASRSGTLGKCVRREEQWAFEGNLAAKEIMHLDKQLASADLRVAIADQDVKVHDAQVENAQRIEEFLQTKFTGVELYGWMQGELSTSFFQAYQVAYDLAKKAERAFRFERGVTSSSFIQFGYWDSLRKGLLAGDRLGVALRQLERAWLDQNRRDYELTKHVSLVRVDPLAFIALRETGLCEVELPEALFDADYPGHYMRRLKSVSISLPCVVGPYTGVSCTVSLLRNRLRLRSAPAEPYLPEADREDDRFATDWAPMQSVATSSGQQDPGIFELNLRDERYLPFEGAGAVSRWRIELARGSNGFDVDTLSDVVLHLRYTARDGGAALRTAALEAEAEAAADVESSPLLRLFSARHELGPAWHRFRHPAADAPEQVLVLDFSRDRFPFQLRGREIAITSVQAILKLRTPEAATRYDGAPSPLVASLGPSPAAAAVSAAFVPRSLLGRLPRAVFAGFGPGAPGSEWVLRLASADIRKLPTPLRDERTVGGEPRDHLKADVIEDIWFLCHYAVD